MAAENSIVPARNVTVAAWRHGSATAATRDVPEEVPVALSYNRDSHAVMLATPQDLADFAIGFSLNDGVISDPAQIEELELVTVPGGIEARMAVAPERLALLDARRRRLAGATGCGLCGLESLAEAMRAPPAILAETRFTADQLVAAMAALPEAQSLNRQTRAVHAAGFWQPSAGLVAVREDVGRHNALDKLAGALARDRIAAAEGFLVMTSRISVELVQKAARMGVPLLVAISVPTALALRTAEACGLTLVGIARGDQFEVFTHPWRIGLSP